MNSVDVASALAGGALIGLSAALLLLADGRIAGMRGIAGRLLDRPDASWPALAIAGLLVGFGTRIGSRRTSGHGLCGLGRLSPRWLVAVIVFMAAARATVALVRHGAPA